MRAGTSSHEVGPTGRARSPDDDGPDEPGARVRLVVTDVDGTLLPYHGTVSGRTRAALAAVVARGVHLVYATGRPPRWMPPVVAATGHAGLAICANGAIVVETSTGAVLDVRAMSPAVVAHAAEVLRDHVPDVRFALESRHGLWLEEGYEQRRRTDRPAGLAPHQPLTAARTVARIEDAAATGAAFKLVASTTALSFQGFLATARRAVGRALTVTASSPATALVEMAAPGVTKGSTLAAVAARLGVRAPEVVAFGDMPNDVEMLTWAGAGFAMGGGHPAAIAAATGTAPPAADDGVAQVLERLVAAGHLGQVVGHPPQQRCP